MRSLGWTLLFWVFTGCGSLEEEISYKQDSSYEEEGKCPDNLELKSIVVYDFICKNLQEVPTEKTQYICGCTEEREPFLDSCHKL